VAGKAALRPGDQVAWGARGFSVQDRLTKYAAREMGAVTTCGGYSGKSVVKKIRYSRLIARQFEGASLPLKSNRDPEGLDQVQALAGVLGKSDEQVSSMGGRPLPGWGEELGANAADACYRLQSKAHITIVAKILKQTHMILSPCFMDSSK